MGEKRFVYAWINRNTVTFESNVLLFFVYFCVEKRSFVALFVIRRWLIGYPILYGTGTYGNVTFMIIFGIFFSSSTSTKQPREKSWLAVRDSHLCTRYFSFHMQLTRLKMHPSVTTEKTTYCHSQQSGINTRLALRWWKKTYQHFRAEFIVVNSSVRMVSVDQLSVPENWFKDMLGMMKMFLSSNWIEKKTH